jgi:hypothetical protein
MVRNVTAILLTAMALVDTALGFTASVLSKPISTTRRSATLTFTAEVAATSDPIGADVSGDKVVEFFRSQEFLQRFCNSDSTAVAVAPLSEEYRQIWEDVCNNEAYRYGPELAPPKNSNAKNENDCSIVFSPSKSKFPGVTVINNITSAVQLLRNAGSFPISYRLVLLSDTRSATGTPFAVWLFNQMTKTKNSTETDDFTTRRPTCRALTTISLLPSINDEGIDNGFCLQVESEVNVMMDVPELIIKVMPMSMERAEAVGSESMVKTVAADIASAFERTASAFVEWNQGVLALDGQEPTVIH